MHLIPRFRASKSSGLSSEIAAVYTTTSASPTFSLLCGKKILIPISFCSRSVRCEGARSEPVTSSPLVLAIAASVDMLMPPIPIKWMCLFIDIHSSLSQRLCKKFHISFIFRKYHLPRGKKGVFPSVRTNRDKNGENSGAFTVIMQSCFLHMPFFFLATNYKKRKKS